MEAALEDDQRQLAVDVSSSEGSTGIVSVQVVIEAMQKMSLLV